MPGVIVYHDFRVNRVDIAVIELTKQGDKFPNYIDVHFGRMKLIDPLYVVGLKVGAADEATESVYKCEVNLIERAEDSAMFQASYSSFDGLSGAGVVTCVDRGITKVVGVHVASHDDTRKHTEVKMTKRKNESANAGRVDLALESIASSIHGHHAYCLICEVARVPTLVSFLRDRGVR
jgi:hypothetical protein